MNDIVLNNQIRLISTGFLNSSEFDGQGTSFNKENIADRLKLNVCRGVRLLY